MNGERLRLAPRTRISYQDFPSVIIVIIRVIIVLVLLEHHCFKKTTEILVLKDLSIHGHHLLHQYGCDIFISSMDGELVDSFHVAANEQTFPMPSMQKFYISIKKT